MSGLEYHFLLLEIRKKLDDYPIVDLLDLCRTYLSSESESNIKDTRSLFKKLEAQKVLEIDNLVVIKGLLKGFREWPLFGKVRRFENKRKEYNALLKKIIRVLDELNDLERLVSICRGKLSEESEGLIEDVRSLFKELKQQNILDLDRLDILKEILTETEKKDLLKEVEKLEERRNNEDEFERKKAPCVGGVSFVVEKLKSAITLVCNFRAASGVVLMVNIAMALRKCESLKDYQETFEKVLLPLHNKLTESRNGSVRFTVESENLIALKELWEIYKDGTLQSRLQEFLVTDEIKQLANGEDIEVTVFIDEHEYNEAYFNLSLLHHQAPNVEEEERPGRRTRRNSDSFLCVKPSENEIGLMKLMEGTEGKWREEKKMLELSIVELEETLRAERTRDLDPSSSTEVNLEKERGSAAKKPKHGAIGEPGTSGVSSTSKTRKFKEYEILERPRKRRRRNSDSNLYYKVRKEEVEQTDNQPERALEGGAQLDFEKGGEHSLYLKDLSQDVIRKLDFKLDMDYTAWEQICESFGMSERTPVLDPWEDEFRRRTYFDFRRATSEFSKILGMFSHVPVKLFKEVLEALQLYDLSDVLDEGKPRAIRSLRPVLSLQEIEKLRNSRDRPISYHSSVAVLIIDGRETCDTEGIEKFFKGLNAKSEVTVMRCRNVMKAAETEYLKKSEGEQGSESSPVSLKKAGKDSESEMDTLRSAFSEVIQSWISNQDKYSLVAVFFIFNDYDNQSYPGVERLIYHCKERLVTAFPTKVKLTIHSFSFWYHVWPQEELFDVNVRFDGEDFLPLMLETFTKRWQTMDLQSMMREFGRSLARNPIEKGDLSQRNFGNLCIDDNLSCLVRFIMHEEPTN